MMMRPDEETKDQTRMSSSSMAENMNNNSNEDHLAALNGTTTNGSNNSSNNASHPLKQPPPPPPPPPPLVTQVAASRQQQQAPPNQTTTTTTTIARTDPLLRPPPACAPPTPSASSAPLNGGAFQISASDDDEEEEESSLYYEDSIAGDYDYSGGAAAAAGATASSTTTMSEEDEEEQKISSHSYRQPRHASLDTLSSDEQLNQISQPYRQRNASLETLSSEDDDESDYSLEHDPKKRPPPPPRLPSLQHHHHSHGHGHGHGHGSSSLTQKDLEMYQRLEDEYEQALEERDVAYTARYHSVRQSACFAVTFMGLFLCGSCTFFTRQTDDWDVADALLFSIYSITTVGYGNLHNPTTPSFQLYTVVFIMVGIALLTIMVAQVYQCLALEASRAQASRDTTTTTSSGSGGVLGLTVGGVTSTTSGPAAAAMVGGAALNSWMPQHHRATTRQRRHQHHPLDAGGGAGSSSSHHHHHNMVVAIGDFFFLENTPILMDRILAQLDRLQTFLKENEIGRGISVLLPFVGLILTGAIVIGTIEGWTAVESLYWAVISLTTVGYGDYYPTRTASIWFSILWLPFSVGFMSMYLTNVAAFYIRLSDRNIVRIERQLQRRIDRAKKRLEQDRRAARERALRGQQWRQHQRHEEDDDESDDNDMMDGNDDDDDHANGNRSHAYGDHGDGGGGDRDNDEESNNPAHFHSLPLPEEVTTGCAAAAKTSPLSSLRRGRRPAAPSEQDERGSPPSPVVVEPGSATNAPLPPPPRRSASGRRSRRGGRGGGGGSGRGFMNSNSQGFDSLPMTEESPRQRRKSSVRKLFGTRGSAINRRERILKESQLGDNSGRTGGAGRRRGSSTLNVTAAPDGPQQEEGGDGNGRTATMTTMRDVLRTVHFNLANHSPSSPTSSFVGPLSPDSSASFRTRTTAASDLFSIRSSETVRTSSLRHDNQRVRKPSFALRVLVQERLAEIIATDVAGYQDSIEIKDHTLSVTIASLKQTADRWKLPRRARKAFRAVAFEALFFVGEYGLVTRGAEALFDLSPLVFHGLFAPLLAALGDAEMMQAWLSRTQVLADVDLRRSPAITVAGASSGRTPAMVREPPPVAGGNMTTTSNEHIRDNH